MKRLMMLFVAGILLVPVVGWGAVVDGFDYPVGKPNANGYFVCQGFLEDVTNSCVHIDWNGTHLGEDWNGNSGGNNDCADNVYATADGTVYRARNYGTCWGDVVILRHSMPDGSTVESLYGHLQSMTVSEGSGNTTVQRGDIIGHMGGQGLTCQGTAMSCHLHFEIRFSNCRSWGDPGPGYSSNHTGWTRPSDFINAHRPGAETPSYACTYIDQWVNGANVNEANINPGATLALAVAYKNVGTATWQNTGGQGNQNYVELESVTAWPEGNPTNCFLDPVGWINGRVHVVACSPASVAQSATATFTFQARISSSAAAGDYPVYFRPFHGTTGLDDWAGLYWLVHVLPPTTPTNLTVNPGGCSQTNSFTFNWSGSSAGASGIKQYHWNINGVGDNWINATSVMTSAPAAGGYTFSVRAEDNAGNFSGYAQTSFCYQPPTGPCPGREISHSPCRQPGDPCLNAANLQTLPDMTIQQWASVGQPVAGTLKAGTKYSIGIEYRSTSNTDLALGLGNFNPSAKDLGMVASQSTLPASSEWRTYWSAPFTVTADQLERFSSLKFFRSSTADGFTIRNVRIVAYQ